MAKQFTGIDGSLYADGNKVAKATSWSFNASADALKTTTLGDFANTYVYGVQSYTGSCSVLYYENDAGQVDGSVLMGDVLRTTQTPTDQTHELELRYENGAKSHAIRFDCLLNSVTVSATAGEIITAQVTFTVTGALKASSVG